MADVAVIGAGLGGLSAALELAADGHRVTVYEAASRLGGKAGVQTVDGLEVDTGPSLLTLPHVFDRALRRSGVRLADVVRLRPLEPAFRYLWPDGTVLDLPPSRDGTIAAVRTALGSDAAGDLDRFLRYAERVWRAAEPHFVSGPAPRLRTLWTPRAIRLLRDIDPLRTLASAIDGAVRSPHLRDVLRRFATYNGSDPRRAPAALASIAYVELGLGAYGVEGGLYRLVEALAAGAARVGVAFRMRTPVRRILRRGRRVTGLVLEGGARVDADVVVANADAGHVAADLVEGGGVPRLPRPLSMSAWNGILKARLRPGAPRAPHTVLFPRRYGDEFRDIFDRQRPPVSPTVYLCAQARAHGRPTWAEHEPVFLMANAPPEPAGGSSHPAQWRALRRRVLARLADAGLVDPEDELRWERTPTDLATRFASSSGALYGAASTSRRAAFQRPPNRIRRVPGLYLASGSAHPGGGMPLAVLSGRAAARAVREDLR
ncbi:MAG: phytoene desaturase family protein [Sandaracinaceae bacterium]